MKNVPKSTELLLQERKDFDAQLARVLGSFSEKEMRSYRHGLVVTQWTRHGIEFLLVMLMLTAFYALDRVGGFLSLGLTMGGVGCLALAFAMKPIFHRLQKARHRRLIDEHIVDAAPVESPASPSGAPTSF